MPYLTSDLIADVKDRAFAPTAQETFDEAAILRIADSKVQSVILPLMQSLRSEHYSTWKDEAIVSGVAAYRIPARALGMQLRDVQLVTSSGDVRDLPQIDPEQVTTTTSGEVRAFYMRANRVVLYPTPSASQDGTTLRLHYFLRPGKLVLAIAAAPISVLASATSLTVSSVPSTWTTANTFDFVRAEGASEPLGIDFAASSVSTTITFTSSVPTDLVLLDYVTLAGESPIPTIPAELRPVLAQATAHQMLQSQKLPGADDAMKLLDMEIRAATTLLTPRVQGAPRTIVARHGWL